MPVSEKVLHRLINLGKTRKAQNHKKQEEQKQKQALLLGKSTRHDEWHGLPWFTLSFEFLVIFLVLLTKSSVGLGDIT